jgi:hypothetical protein
VSGELHARPLYPQGKSPWYPLGRKLDGPQSRSGRGGEEKNTQPPLGIEPRSSDRPAGSQSMYRLNTQQSISMNIVSHFSKVNFFFVLFRLLPAERLTDPFLQVFQQKLFVLQMSHSSLPLTLLFYALKLGYFWHAFRRCPKPSHYADQATGWTTGVRFPAGAEYFLRHRFQTGSWVHPDCFPMDSGDHFPGGIAGEGWSWPLTSTYNRS